MSLLSVTYGLSITTIVLFGVGALIFARYRQRRFKHEDTTEFFLTARRSVQGYTIAWSFYASGVGAWVIFSMPAYVISAGIVGLVAYSIACGLPIYIVARVGSVLRRKYPGVLSLGDFVQWRFGTVPMLLVTLIMLLNMFIALCAEFTAIGNLFEWVIGGPRLPIVVVVAVVTSIYTSAGGLYVSIMTDVAQGVFSIFLLVVMAIYVAATYRPESLPTPLPPNLGANYYGWAACAAMPISTTCATIFSEGPWQRIWASADEKALRKGSILGSIGLVVVCFLYGFGGFLAIWAGFPLSDEFGSTAFFDLLSAGKGLSSAPSWIIIIASLSVVTMNEGAVDTLQNAIVDTIVSRIFRGRSIWYPRVIVFLINIPIVFVSLKGYNIISLFLLGNLICTFCAVPLLLGLVDRLEGIMGSLSAGMHYTFMESYDWPSFVLPLVFSAIGVAIAAAIECGVRKSLGLAYPVPLQIPREATQTEFGEEGSGVESKASSVHDADLYSTKPKVAMN
ncbi:hypothetical protein BGW38_003165 [Lunasporangiospora selenospora]|uniref:Na+/proline symporter n=1 Tax=Lunasporangiospora selenospora TaxID=979761 RepID=A0A9P6FR14_9FUNG|nr:hypothetical protein BGW38_003165 [Lunasporangiospora selenospora]